MPVSPRRIFYGYGDDEANCGVGRMRTDVCSDAAGTGFDDAFTAETGARAEGDSVPRGRI